MKNLDFSAARYVEWMKEHAQPPHAQPQADTGPQAPAMQEHAQPPHAQPPHARQRRSS